MCGNDYLGIVDTRDKRVAEVIRWGPTSADPLGNRANITAIRWTDSFHLEFQAEMYDSATCFAGRNSAKWPVSGTVDVRKEKFR
jgi:hypothetical protein